MPSETPQIQVNTEHYDFSKYVSWERWSSYWHQLHEIDTVRPNDVLCIGIGDDIVPSILQRKGYAVSRFDFDPRLEPDYVGGVGDVRKSVDNRIFDAVLCCQVLEHQPFEKLAHTLEQLLSITKSRLVVSLPYSHVPMLRLKLRLYRSVFADLDLLVQKFWKPWKFDGEHYWEVGAREFPMSRIAPLFHRQGFKTRHFHAKENPYHLFLVMDRL